MSAPKDTRSCHRHKYLEYPELVGLTNTMFINRNVLTSLGGSKLNTNPKNTNSVHRYKQMMITERVGLYTHV